MNELASIIYDKSTGQVLRSAYSNVIEIDLEHDKKIEEQVKVHINLAGGALAVPRAFGYVDGNLKKLPVSAPKPAPDKSRLPKPPNGTAWKFAGAVGWYLAPEE